MTDVVFPDPSRMNLLGYFLRSALRRAVATDAGRSALEGVAARVRVETAGMAVTMTLAPTRIEIVQGDAGPADASVAGALGALLRTLRTGGFVGAVLLGRVRVRGAVRVRWALRGLFAR